MLVPQESSRSMLKPPEPPLLWSLINSLGLSETTRNISLVNLSVAHPARNSTFRGSRKTNLISNATPWSYVTASETIGPLQAKSSPKSCDNCGAGPAAPRGASAGTEAMLTWTAPEVRNRVLRLLRIWRILIFRDQRALVVVVEQAATLQQVIALV